ncbi:Exodeoxyribonuclease III [Chitinispirillum alkaliphilum]|nr:Exodeoxyribonuclease III [Chitinispirillum alkaliphilum]
MLQKFKSATTYDEIQVRENPIKLKIMSFNVRYGTAKDGKNSWSHRRDLVFDLLKNSSCDIFGLQEALHFQIEEIMEQLNHFGYIGKGRDDGKKSGEHNVIFYNPRKYKILKSGTFWFSDTPSVAGSKHWGNKLPRICTWAHFWDRETSRDFYVYNVHLDHRNGSCRKKSIELLCKKASQHEHKNTPYIVMGDFNVGEKNEIIHFLKGKNKINNSENPLILEDTFRKLHPNATGGTFHMFWGNKRGPKLDYIFATQKCSVLESNIIRTNVNGKFPSDHFPIYSHLLLQ